MKNVLLILVLIATAGSLDAQYVYTIKADSVKITNCDSAELILENHTQNIPGFLFNTGNGRTIFKRAAVRLNDTTYLVGADTVKLPNAWVQGGNTFGATGILGTLDNNHLDFYTNGSKRMRLSNAGNLLMGANTDNGDRIQIVGRGGVLVDPMMSTPYDFIKIGGYYNTSDGQDIVLSASADSGQTYTPLVLARDGYMGLGSGATNWIVGTPPIRLYPNGIVSMQPTALYFGNSGGPYNASALVTSVSNVNEWTQIGLDTYPNGQNYYYFGTWLGTPQPGYKRAPLKISGNELYFLTGATDTQAVKISEGQNFLIGTTTDNGNRLQVNGNSYFNNNVCMAGLTADSTKTRVLVADAQGNVFYRDASSLAADNPLRTSLAVNGPITAKKLTLAGDPEWPDYVFDSTYRLMPLTTVGSYIQKEHHLPGVPAATEIQKQGLDVGANQATLLKKIEELTLYNIDQEKKIQALQNEVRELKELILMKASKN